MSSRKRHPGTSSAPGAATHYIVKAGKPAAVIVLDPDSPKMVALAANPAAEIREREHQASVVGGKFYTPYRGDDSSSYGGPIKTD